VTQPVRTAAAGLGFVEGPSLLRSGGLVVVSLDHQCVYEVAAGAPANAVARMDAAPNGSTEGHAGALYLAAFSGAWPARPDCDGDGGVFVWHEGGPVSVLSAAPAAPNDLCFGPDGLLYVTDPVRGGAAGRLWRIDPATGAAEVFAAVDWYPNGIGFDAQDNLWVADTVGRRLLAFDVSTNPQARSGRGDPTAVIDLPFGKPDGFAFDADGHLVLAAPRTPEHPTSTVQIFDADGAFVDVLLDEGSAYYTNVAITPDGTVYVTEAEQGRVLALHQACAPGLRLHPFRNR
jgi:gluconolactonase